MTAHARCLSSHKRCGCLVGCGRAGASSRTAALAALRFWRCMPPGLVLSTLRHAHALSPSWRLQPACFGNSCWHARTADAATRPAGSARQTCTAAAVAAAACACLPALLVGCCAPGTRACNHATMRARTFVAAARAQATRRSSAAGAQRCAYNAAAAACLQRLMRAPRAPDAPRTPSRGALCRCESCPVSCHGRAARRAAHIGPPLAC
jgi:hypothetical protein